MNKEFRYKCNAGVYETDSYFGLGWMIFSHRCWHLWNHGKKKSIFDSGTTKGSAPRKSNKKKYDENWEKIFGKKKNKDTKSK